MSLGNFDLKAPFLTPFLTHFSTKNQWDFPLVLLSY